MFKDTLKEELKTEKPSIIRNINKEPYNFKSDFKEDRQSSIDIFVKDHKTGQVHKVGTRKKDALGVTAAGVVYYVDLDSNCKTYPGVGFNLGFSSPAKDGYEFLKSYAGRLEQEKEKEYIRSLLKSRTESN